NNNSFDSSGFSSDVSSVSLLYNNGLQVKQLRGNVRMSDSVLKIQDLNTAFNQSQLKIYGDIILPLKPSKFFTNSSRFIIEDLSVFYSDLLWIQPALKKQLPLSLLPSDKITLSGNFFGTARGLKAKQLMLSSSGKQFRLKGDVEFKMEKAGADIS